MNTILTDDDIYNIHESCQAFSNFAYERAIEAAVLAKLAAQATCKEHLQVWVIPDGKGGGQFSWTPQNDRFWIKLTSTETPSKD